MSIARLQRPNVRNFWLELTVDGGTKRIETGPRSKDGGFSLTILQRDKGGIVRTLEVHGIAEESGGLRLAVHWPYRDAGGDCTLNRDEQSLTIRTSR